ncbi:MAG: glucosyltransferase domain-containing protein, partial [Clostridia bacterium]|nr:glucosyltransferase domain-containing protein [Clostridia bacterium]
MIRGPITAPLPIGLFATAALAGAAVLIVSMLGLTSRLPILLVCGVLATNETLSVSYATYLPWVDVYMIAFFFSIAGVYVSVRFRHGWLISPLLYLIALALYQSYLQTAVVMILILLLLRLLNGEPVKDIWLFGVRSCLALLAGLLLYALGLRLVLAALGLAASDNYNGVTRVGSMALSKIPQLLMTTFRYPLQFFMRNTDSAFVSPIFTCALLVLALPVLVCFAWRLSPGGKLTLLFLLVMLPLGSNFVAFISQGIVHPLMVYSFFFLYVLCIALIIRM